MEVWLAWYRTSGLILFNAPPVNVRVCIHVVWNCSRAFLAAVKIAVHCVMFEARVCPLSAHVCATVVRHSCVRQSFDRGDTYTNHVITLPDGDRNRCSRVGNLISAVS